MRQWLKLHRFCSLILRRFPNAMSKHLDGFFLKKINKMLRVKKKTVLLLQLPTSDHVCSSFPMRSALRGVGVILLSWRYILIFGQREEPRAPSPKFQKHGSILCTRVRLPTQLWWGIPSETDRHLRGSDQHRVSIHTVRCSLEGLWGQTDFHWQVGFDLFSSNSLCVCMYVNIYLCIYLYMYLYEYILHIHV